MSIMTYTITPERLSQIEQAVGFEIEDNRDLDYALDQLVKNAWDK